jgi:hypothetical protein
MVDVVMLGGAEKSDLEHAYHLLISLSTDLRVGNVVPAFVRLGVFVWAM